MDILENLNSAQKQAVQNTDGPMLIIAGAGTGKTRVITARILHLLRDKNVHPGQILALTFTEKAAAEMVERVDIALPLSYEEITIKTFHSFCDQMLRESGIEIGIDPGFKVLDQTQQWLMLKKHLFDLELDYYRPLGNPSKFLFVLINHFSRLKDEDIDPDTYLAYAESLIKKAADDSEKEEAKKKMELAKAYGTFQKIKSENNFLDFGDLQYYALRLLEKRKNVLNAFQERYKYIMVDEFQDTNFAQNKLVLLLADKYKNLAVVGDDDQSIYKWRGASLSNIMNFEKNFPGAKKIVLTENYRSSQKILDAAYGLIKNNNPYRLEDRENISKRLTGNSGEGENIEILHFNSYVNEAEYIAGKIAELSANGVEYSKIAVLVRANQHAVPVASALKNLGIPFKIRDTVSLLHFDEIKDLLALLRFLVWQKDDVALFRILSMPIFDLKMSEIISLMTDAKADDYKPAFQFLKEAFSSEDGSTLPGLGQANKYEGFRKICNFLDEMIAYIRRQSVSRILNEFLDKSGYYKQLIAVDSQENLEKIQRIGAFINIAHDFENENGETSVKSFLEYLDLIEEANGIMPSIPDNEQDAVSVLTVHSAKGLEYDYVYAPSLVKQRFPSTGKNEPISIPDELIKEELPAEDMHIGEERRLFYVLCTRAAKKLILSYADAYEGNKKWKKSPFLDELAIDEKLVTIKDLAEENDAKQIMPENPESEHNQKLSYLPEIKINHLSYSQLDSFQTCPLKYKFRYLFSIPSPSPHTANFGSSVHETVNEFYKAVIAGEKPSLEMLEKIYNETWIGNGYESKAHEQKRKIFGWKMMENFFSKEKENNFIVPAFLEKAFSLKIGDIRFTGRIDRIDKLPDGSYEVIDYKTGSYKKDTNLKKDLQLSIYALACRDVYKIPVSRLSLYFLEDLNKVSATRSDDDLKDVKNEIQGIADDMMKSDFSPTPGFHCGYCDFRLLCAAAQ